MDGEQIFDYVMNSPENTNPSVLRSIINNAKELPDVSSEDEGKVLTVNDNGKWSAIMPQRTHVLLFDFYTASQYQSGTIKINANSPVKEISQIYKWVNNGEPVMILIKSIGSQSLTTTLLDLCSWSPGLEDIFEPEIWFTGGYVDIYTKKLYTYEVHILCNFDYSIPTTFIDFTVKSSNITFNE